MTNTDEETSKQPTDRTDWPIFERRPLLKALGLGTALSLGSGVVTAQNESDAGDDMDGGDGMDSGGSGDGTDDQAEIDPQFGLPIPDAATIPDDIEPAQEVTLHTAEPADPENPAHPPLFYFEPSGLHVESGDIVQFTLRAPDHTITAYHPALGFQQRVPDRVPPFSSPVLNIGAAWFYEFGEEGIYDLYCGPHHVLGMNMRVVVGDLAEEDIPEYEDTFEGSEDPPLLPPFSKEFLEHELNATSDQNENCEWSWLTPQEILDAPSLDPSTIQEQGTVPFESVLSDIDRFPDELPEHEEDGGEEETGAATVQVREHDEYGNILVGPDGMTLYLFLPDGSQPNESTCYGSCAVTWPPLTVDGEPVAGDNVGATIGTLERRTGETQVMANGWPLYYYEPDEQPGDANGQGANEVWWVVDPDGSPIRSA